MDKCRRGVYWLPKTNDLNNAVCVEPPQKRVIWEELKRLLLVNRLSMGIKSLGQLDVNYILSLIATLEPDH